MLQTERLLLIPLNLEQLRLWVSNLPALESELECTYAAEPLEGIFLDIANEQIAITQTEPEHYAWHGFWLLIRKADRVVVGLADFKGTPNENGEVEIGYGLGKQFEGRGYMTETVKAMCVWALGQKNVRAVFAETDTDGYFSHRVLQRCGFTKTACADTMWWGLPKGNQTP